MQRTMVRSCAPTRALIFRYKNPSPSVDEERSGGFAFRVKFADMVNLSFVWRPEDVILLAKHIVKLGATRIGVVFKIENARRSINCRVSYWQVCGHRLSA